LNNAIGSIGSGVRRSHSTNESTRAAVDSATKRAGTSMTEVVKHLQPYLDRIADDYRPTRSGGTSRGGPDLDQEALFDEGFSFGLERLLDGLEAWLNRPSGDRQRQ
jgi:hypothetical protein